MTRPCILRANIWGGISLEGFPELGKGSPSLRTEAGDVEFEEPGSRTV